MARQPIYPSNDSNPTAQGRRETTAANALRRKLREVGRLYRALLDRIEFQAVTTNAVTYEFRTVPSVLSMMISETERLTDQILLDGGADRLWFFASFVQPAYVQGTNQAMTNLSAQSVAYKATRPNLQTLLMSDPYQRRLGLLRAREFELMKGFTAETKSNMVGALMRGLATGLGPRAIARDLQKATGIDERRAERIARTEVNTAFTNARMDEALQAQQDFGLTTRVMHVSAFSPTTRPNHAARHGKLFTVAEQQQWWSQGGERINCLCSVVEVTVDESGEPLSPGFVEKAKARRKRWEDAQNS